MAHSDYLMRTLQQLAHMLAALFGGARGRDLAETMARLDVISGTFTGLSLPVLRGMSYDDLRGLFSVTGTFAVERGYAAARVLHADAMIAAERGAGVPTAQALTAFRLLADATVELGGFVDEPHEQAFSELLDFLLGERGHAEVAAVAFRALRDAGRSERAERVLDRWADLDPAARTTIESLRNGLLGTVQDGAAAATPDGRVGLFDGWAARYDRSVGAAEGFPFEGYERVLDEVVHQADAGPGMTVLDLGVGTGNLAVRFAAEGRGLWGLDASGEMLARAREKLPDAVLVRADLLGEWPAELERRFDRIVSSYLFHEFEDATKVGLLRRLADRSLAPGGRIVVGDVAFPTASERASARARWADAWDDDEHYWAADDALAACRGAGLHVAYRQVSWCAGVFVVEPVTPDPSRPRR